MRQSETIKSLLEALAKAQSEFVTLPKDKTGYGYKYTDLDTVIKTVRPIMAKYGLGFMQSLTTFENGRSGITTRVFSSMGEYIEDTVALPDVAMAKTNAAQNMGAAITYMKRYALCAVLGISSDEDVDGATITTQTQQQTMSPAAQKERNSWKQQQEKKAAAQQAPQIAGGPDTPAQTKLIMGLLDSKDAAGEPLFDEKDRQKWTMARKTKTAQQVIDELTVEVAERSKQREALDGLVD